VTRPVNQWDANNRVIVTTPRGPGILLWVTSTGRAKVRVACTDGQHARHYWFSADEVEAMTTHAPTKLSTPAVRATKRGTMPVTERPATLDRDGEEIARAVRRQLAALADAVMGAERVMHYATNDVEALAAEIRSWRDAEEHPLGSIEGGGIGDDISERFARRMTEVASMLTQQAGVVALKASYLEVLCDRARVLRSHGIHDVEPDEER
jgi:hypothetical protein